MRLRHGIKRLRKLFFRRERSKSFLSVNGESNDIRRLSCPGYIDDASKRPVGRSDIHRLSVAEPTPSYSLESLDQGDEDPNGRQQRVHNRLFRFQKEVERVCMRMRFAKTTLKSKLSSTKSNNSEGDENERRVRIEYSDAPKQRGRSKSKCHIYEEADGVIDSREHNYSTSLIIEPLCDGNFTAILPLDPFPTEDDIIVRVRNYKLEILLEKRPAHKPTKRDKHTLSYQAPYRCGDVDLPIYVDTGSLRFTMDTPNTLNITARTKFVLSRRLSISSDDITIKKPSQKQSSSKDPYVKRTYLDKEKGEKQTSKGQTGVLQRQRSYTQ